MFDFWPELRPDPRERESAAVRIVAVEPGVPYDDWLRRTSRDAEDLAKRRKEYVARTSLPGDTGNGSDVLQVRGHVLFVETTIEGYKRRNVDLLWTMYRAESKTRVTDKSFHEVRAVEVNLDAPTDRSVALLWVPSDPAREHVFIRVELTARDGTTLAVGDSPKFSGTGLK